MPGRKQHAIEVPFALDELQGASVEYSVLDGPHQIGEFLASPSINARVYLTILGPLFVHVGCQRTRILRDGYHINRQNAPRVKRAGPGAPTAFTCLEMTRP